MVHCATSVPSECTAQPTIWTTVDVANPVTWDAPTEPRFVDLAADEKLAITVTDDGPGQPHLAVEQPVRRGDPRHPDQR